MICGAVYSTLVPHHELLGAKFVVGVLATLMSLPDVLHDRGQSCIAFAEPDGCDRRLFSCQGAEVG